MYLDTQESWTISQRKSNEHGKGAFLLSVQVIHFGGVIIILWETKHILQAPGLDMFGSYLSVG